MKKNNIDFKELITRIVKYILEGLIVGLVSFTVPNNKLSASELIIISITAASVFAILDLVKPSIS
jgi:hypothetical protein